MSRYRRSITTTEEEHHLKGLIIILEIKEEEVIIVIHQERITAEVAMRGQTHLILNSLVRVREP